jgi:biopolymer transport protein ExbD
MKLKLSLPRDDDDELDLTPMIDCVFQLILFFMLTSSFIDEAKGFAVTLPQADQATTIAREKIDSITVTVDGRYTFRSGTHPEKPVKDLEELLHELRGRDAASRQRAVIIRCDARCEYQQFIRVKNVLKLAGVETIFEEVHFRGS